MTLANPVLVRCHIDGQVTEMDFSRLKLQGQLISDIGSLKALRTLSLHNNAITGPLPDTLGGLEQLEFLLLYKNQFTGPLAVLSVVVWCAYKGEVYQCGMGGRAGERMFRVK